MKLQLILFIILILICTFKADPSAVDKALNPDPNPNCVGDCKVLKKVQAIFPLRGDEKNIDTQLNYFNWKFFFVFSDHLSVYSTTQSAPVSGKPEKPQEVDFLNNFPIDDIQTPCNGYKDVCTVYEYREQIYKPISKDFAPNSKAMDAMGKDLWNNCLLLTQDLLESPEDMSYVCSNDINDFKATLRILNENINKFEGKEFVGRLYLVNDNHDDLVELNAHLDSTTFVGNNVNDDIQSGPVKEGYKEFFRYNLLNDFAAPAFSLLKENVKLDWKGSDDKKPDIKTCLGITLLLKGGREQKERYLCALTTNNGTIKLDAPQSNLEVIEWVTKLNRRLKNQKLKTAQEALKSITSETVTVEVTTKISVFKDEIKDLANKVEKDCQQKAMDRVSDVRNCEEMRKKVVAEKCAELCQGSKNCLKALETQIAAGALNDKIDSNNLYKARAELDALKTNAAGATGTTGATAGSSTGGVGSASGGAGSASGNAGSGSGPGGAGSGSGSGSTAQTGAGAAAKDSAVDKLLAGGSADTGKSAGVSTGDQGQTVVSQLGAEKAKDSLSKELTNNGDTNALTPKTDTAATAAAASQTSSTTSSDSGEAASVKSELGQPAPSKEEIQKALNTFKRVFYGRTVDKIDGIENYCAGSTTGLDRAIGILPFLSPFDPFLEYLGHIRDVQSQKS